MLLVSTTTTRATLFRARIVWVWRIWSAISSRWSRKMVRGRIDAAWCLAAVETFLTGRTLLRPLGWSSCLIASNARSGVRHRQRVVARFGTTQIQTIGNVPRLRRSSLLALVPQGQIRSDAIWISGLFQTRPTSCSSSRIHRASMCSSYQTRNDTSFGSWRQTTCTGNGWTRSFVWRLRSASSCGCRAPANATRAIGGRSGGAVAHARHVWRSVGGI